MCEAETENCVKAMILSTSKTDEVLCFHEEEFGPVVEITGPCMGQVDRAVGLSGSVIILFHPLSIAAYPFKFIGGKVGKGSVHSEQVDKAHTHNHTYGQFRLSSNPSIGSWPALVICKAKLFCIKM